MVEHMAFKLKVDDKIDMSFVYGGRKGPGIGKMLQWSFDGVYLYLPWPIQRDLASEALLKHTEPDHEISHEFLLILMQDASPATPRDERRIISYIRNDFKKLVRRSGLPSF